MPITKAYPRVLHLFFNAVIVGLFGYICYEKYTDQDTAVQQSLQQAFQQAVPEIRDFNHFLKEKLLKNAVNYRNPLNERAKQLALDITAEADTLLRLIDSLQRRPNPALLYLVQGKLPNFRSRVWEKLEYEPSLAPKMNAFFIPDNWLYIATKYENKTQLTTVLDQAKTNVALIERLALSHLYQKYAGGERLICWFGAPPVMSFSPLNPKVGDTIIADVILPYYLESAQRSILRLNGQILPVREDVGEFKVRHKTPGIYPLHFSLSKTDWRTDSMSTVEKTYYLRVD